jgi:hypothetical protein
MATQPAGAFDRPTTLGELLRPAQQLAVAAQRRRNTQRRHRRVRRRVERCGGVRALVRVNPDDHLISSYPVSAM